MLNSSGTKITEL